MNNRLTFNNIKQPELINVLNEIGKKSLNYYITVNNFTSTEYFLSVPENVKITFINANMNFFKVRSKNSIEFVNSFFSTLSVASPEVSFEDCTGSLYILDINCNVSITTSLIYNFISYGSNDLHIISSTLKTNTNLIYNNLCINQSFIEAPNIIQFANLKCLCSYYDTETKKGKQGTLPFSFDGKKTSPSIPDIEKYLNFILDYRT